MKVKKSYKKGGNVVGPKKAPRVNKLSDSYIKQQEEFAKVGYKSYIEGLKKTGKKVYATDKFKAETAAMKNMYADLDYASLSPKDKKFVDNHKKQAGKFSSYSVSSLSAVKKK